LQGQIGANRLNLSHPRHDVRLDADVLFDGHTQFEAQSDHWTNTAGRFTVRNGGLYVPRIGTIQQFGGSVQFEAEQLTAVEFSGQWVDLSPVALTGSIRDVGTRPEGELTLTVQAHLDEDFYGVLPASLILFNPQGRVALTAHWQGPLPLDAATPWTAWPLTATLRIDEGALVVPGLRPESLQAMTGTMQYAQDRLEIPLLTFTHADRAYTLTATAQDLSTQPHLVAHLEGPAFRGHLEATLSPQRLNVARLAVTSRHSQLVLAGELTPTTPSQLNLAGRGTLTLADLAAWPVTAQVLTDWPLTGTLPLTFTLQGTPQAPRAHVQWRASDLHLRELPVHLNHGELRWDEHGFTVPRLELLVADGRVTLSDGALGVPRHQQACHGTFAVDGVQLEPLVRTLWPARERYPTGVLTAAATLRGDRCEPSALQGSGEFHIRDARLGSIPLLDKVFWGLLGALADRLDYPELRQAELVEAVGTWRLAEGKITTDKTLVIATYAGSRIPIIFEGWVGLDHQLNVLVDAQVPADVLQYAPGVPATLRNMFRAVSILHNMTRLVGRQRITGTLERPVSSFEFSFEELANQLLAPAL